MDGEEKAAAREGLATFITLLCTYTVRVKKGGRV
jgi:hypothetical protein